ncbi:MAG: thiamine ABC transporter ATP-binding protein [Gammaproteobacteria bacterium]
MWLEVEGVEFRYEDMLMRFDLQIEAGECVAIIGPSGAGKSTLLALIAGFERPLAGRIAIGGRDVSDLPPAERPITTVFQEHNLFPHLDVAANVGLGIHPGLKLGEADRARIRAALAQVELAGMERRQPAQLSGGERQRVALARALVRRRPLLLLDEPFAALGPALRREMLDLVDALRRREGMTVLLVSHHPDDARRIAGRTAFVQAGRILRMDHTARLLDDPTLPELRDYLGDAPA